MDYGGSLRKRPESLRGSSGSKAFLIIANEVHSSDTFNDNNRLIIMFVLGLEDFLERIMCARYMFYRKYHSPCLVN